MKTRQLSVTRRQRIVKYVQWSSLHCSQQHEYCAEMLNALNNYQLINIHDIKTFPEFCLVQLHILRRFLRQSACMADCITTWRWRDENNNKALTLVYSWKYRMQKLKIQSCQVISIASSEFHLFNAFIEFYRQRF